MEVTRVFVLIGLLVSAECATFSYNSFDASNQGNFRFNLNAPRYNNPPNGALTLTLSQGSDAGSVFTQSTIQINGFSTSFGFIIDQGAGSDGSGQGADGIVFILSGFSNAGGQSGGGLGYSGVPRSLGVEFDTWYNPENGDIDGNHIGIDINGNIRSVQQRSVPDLLNSGLQMYAWVDYNSDTTTLEVRYTVGSTTRPTDPFISRVIDLSTVFGNSDVFAGFSAATGGSINRHRITSWSFENTYRPIVVIPSAVCGNGIVETGEQCDSTSSCCNSCAFASSATVCRGANGACDVAETCTGSSDSCPADSFSASSTVCRGSNGPCDAAETCTGSSASCPADSFAASSTVCRASAGDCDVAESCTGSSASCPADSFSSSVCRPSAGPCDVAETCTGSSASCPADSFSSSSSVCRQSAGDCDVAETCTGSSASCPADSFSSSSSVCRASAGNCDVAESCTGSSASCPADAVASSATVCRASAGACDVAETCTGSSVSCPADAIASSATVCRPAANSCDVAEKCTGASVTCPADVLSNSTSCFCARQNLADGQMGYYCTVNGGYYQCLGGVYASQSRAMKCGAGTQCACGYGAECSCNQSRSPCLRPTDPNTCN